MKLLLLRRRPRPRLNSHSGRPDTRVRPASGQGLFQGTSRSCSDKQDKQKAALNASAAFFLELRTSQAAERPIRRRATSAAAAAPKRRTIGGAGTGVPPVDPVGPPLEVDELVLELVLALVLALVLLEVLVLLPPKLLELDVEDTFPLEVEVEPPLVLEVEETLPLDVEPPLVEVEPPLVEVEPPLVELELPPVEVELPPLPPLDVLVEAVKIALLLPPPKKAPLKKPLPNPLPKPLPLPPMTIGTLPPLMTGITPGGGGGGSAIGGGAAG